MTLSEDLKSSVTAIFSRSWTIRDGRVVPEPGSISLANDAVKVQATVLYADMAESTNMVDSQRPDFAAEIYKAYLLCAAKIIRSEGGTITAYDGDRVMAVYMGDSKNSSATRTALKINYAVKSLINPAVAEQYRVAYEVKHVVGVDTSALLVAQTGIRGSNDLVWVGRAANHAAKLTTLAPEFPSWITKEVYDVLPLDLRESGGRVMWGARRWTAMGDRLIYCSNWTWRL